MISGRPISRWERPTAESAEEIASTRIALTLPRPQLMARLEERVDQMYGKGLIEETRTLLQRYPRDARPFGAIGYREAVAVIEGRMPQSAAVSETKRRTRAYAKRQMTWLRAERNVHWVAAADRSEAFGAALRLVEGEK